jgi:amino acid permease
LLMHFIKSQGYTGGGVRDSPFLRILRTYARSHPVNVILTLALTYAGSIVYISSREDLYAGQTRLV